MQPIFKISGLYLFVFIVSILSSCKKEDNIPPVITAFNLKMNDSIRNTFVIKVEATDNSSTARLELFANDSLIASVDKVPFEYPWNTMKMKDGDYSIKAVVYDSNGNKTESSCLVTVQNAFLVINLGSENHSLFKFVISDEQGNILNTALVTGSGKVRIMPISTCENEAINFVYCNSSYDFTGLIAHVHVKRGSEFNMDWNYKAPVVKGVRLHLKNDIGSFTQIRLSTDQGSYNISTMADTINLPQSIPYTSGHKLLLQLETSNGRFYRFLTIDNITELSEKLSDINTLMAVKTFYLPPTRNSTYLIQGISNEPDSSNRYYISQGQNEYNVNHLDIYYPSEYFSKYQTTVNYSPTDNNFKFYLNQYRGDIPDNFDPLSVNFEIVNFRPDNFRANISGNFDLYNVEYYNQSKTIELKVAVPANQKEWKLPDLSTAFENPEYNFDNFKWDQASVLNMSSIDWSDNYFDISVNFEKLNYYEKYAQYLWIFNPSGKGNKQIRISEGY